MNKPIRTLQYFSALLLALPIVLEQGGTGSFKGISQAGKQEKQLQGPVKTLANTGDTISIVLYNFSFHKFLVDLVDEGVVPIARIGDAVHRILRVKLKSGLWDTPFIYGKGHKKNIALAPQHLAFDEIPTITIILLSITDLYNQQKATRL